MTHVSTKMKRNYEVAIYENKRARGRHKGKGYTIATVSYIDLLSCKANLYIYMFICFICMFT